MSRGEGGVRGAGAARARVVRPRIAVVGAGLAGLSCATALQSAGLPVQVFEKGRGPAGRMSTRRGAGWQCDHGAQYFTARDPAFLAEVRRWEGAGVAARWSPRLTILGERSGENTDPCIERFVGSPRMTAPAAWLAASLPVSAGQTVLSLARVGSSWQLASMETGQLGDGFDIVLLAVPAPQAAVLLADAAPELSRLAGTATMRGCWALMLQFEAPPELGYDAAFVNGGPIRWIARDGSKPGREGQDTWLLHAEAGWSEAHLEADAATVADALLAAFAALGGPAPSAWTAHRWRYADSAPPLAIGCAWSAEIGLGLCGDWLDGGRVEGAWASGRALARAVCVFAGAGEGTEADGSPASLTASP